MRARTILPGTTNGVPAICEKIAIRSIPSPSSSTPELTVVITPTTSPDGRKTGRPIAPIIPSTTIALRGFLIMPAMRPVAKYGA